MATLRKSDMSSRVAAKLGGSRAQGEAALNAVLDSIQEVLGSGDRVVLTGFRLFRGQAGQGSKGPAYPGRQGGKPDNGARSQPGGLHRRRRARQGGAGLETPHPTQQVKRRRRAGWPAFAFSRYLDMYDSSSLGLGGCRRSAGRFVVIGTSGAGKTTIARQVASVLGIPHVELDAYRHGPKLGTETPDDLFRGPVERGAEGRTRGSRMVNYTVAREVVWPKGTTVVWLGLLDTRRSWSGCLAMPIPARRRAAQIPHLDKRKTSLEPATKRAKMFS